MGSSVHDSNSLWVALQKLSMASLVIPDEVVLRLLDAQEHPITFPNVLFFVHLFASRKNDFVLQPFPTDSSGVVVISKEHLLAEVAAHYDSGLMDYASVETCKPTVEIGLMEPPNIERAFHARTNVWKTLLRGESERWSSIEDLRKTYRMAANHQISAPPIKVQWDESAGHCEYSIVGTFR